MVNKDLPQDVWLDIFSRLPAKCIGRMRCLSKPWCHLLSTTQFIKFHLTRARDESLILITSCHSLATMKIPSKGNNVLRFMNSPISNLTCFWGSCNGLVLLSNCEKDYLCVVNPVTRQGVKIPYSLVNKPEDESRTTYGFGYDCSNDDYKILKLSTYDTLDYDLCNVLEVFSVKKGAWTRAAESCGFPFNQFHSGAFVNNTIHWLATRKSDEDQKYFNEIRAFDFVSETFYEIPNPPGFDVGNFEPFELLVLEGCLCIVNLLTNSNIEVWVMKDYGLVESWTKIDINVDRKWGTCRLVAAIGDELREILWVTLWGSLVMYNMKRGYNHSLI